MSYKGHIAGCYFLVPVTCRYCMPSVRKYLPQVDVQAQATILSTTARVTLTQKFDVPWKDQGIRKLNYTFPLFDGVSVVGFKCHVKDRVIVGEVKEKEEARQVFDEAIQQGQVAGLLEQLPDASDVFTTTVGNIPPDCTVIIEITYLSELRHDAEVDGIRFTIPTTIAPRYGSYPGELATSAATAAASGKFEVVVDTTLDSGSSIRQLSSPTHPISVSLGTLSTALEDDPALNKASATLSLGSAEMDRDFVLQIVSKGLGKPVAVLENHPQFSGHRALMATLVPKFQMKPHQPEIVFICDRSGSMGGYSIKALKNALNVLVKSLPVGILFNICSFGSSFEFLWPKSEPYNQGTVQKAVQYINSFDANFGGTEMYAPLKEALDRRFKDRSMELFLVTDGEIWNEQKLFDLLNDRIGVKKEPVRVFTLGIGHDASHSLINGVARAGNGFAQSVGPNEKLDAKVVRMLKGALFPHVNDYSLEIKYSKDQSDEDDFEIVEKVSDGLRVEADMPPEAEKKQEKKPISLFDQSANPDATPITAGGEGPKVAVPKYIQAPQAIPPLFPFSRTTVYVLLEPEGPKGTPTSVILRGTSSQGPLELEIPVSALEAAGETIHQLAAKRAVSDLEEGRGWLQEATLPSGELVRAKHPSYMADLVRAECVRLGVKFQVGGKYCSFVATEVKGADQAMAEDFAFVEDKLESLTLSERGKHTCWASRQTGSVTACSAGDGLAPPLPPPPQPKPAGFRGGRRGSRGAPGLGRGGARHARNASPQDFKKEHFSMFGSRTGSLGAARPALYGGGGPQLQDASVFPSPAPRGAPPMQMMQTSMQMPQMEQHMQQRSMQSQMVQNQSSSFGFGGFGSGGSGGGMQRRSSAGFGLASIGAGVSAKLHGATKKAGSVLSDMSVTHEYISDEKRKRTPKSAKFRAVSDKFDDEYDDSELGVDRLEESDQEEMQGPVPGSLQGLIALQTFEGFWEWDKRLRSVVGVKESVLAQFDAGVDAKVVATVLAVKYLEVRLNDDKDGWELLVEKAKTWLETMVGDEKAGELFAVAEKVIVQGGRKSG